jgi:hypothetical protein
MGLDLEVILKIAFSSKNFCKDMEDENSYKGEYEICACIIDEAL